MKRMVAVLLAVALTLALTIPALAENAMEDDLAQITLKVKTILDVEDNYTEFTGDYYDSLRPGWNLYWSDESRSMSVTCTADGLITEVYRWTDLGHNSRFYGFSAAFPAVSEETARSQAEDLLGRLMGEGETARIDDMDVALAESGGYTFRGTVLINDVESPITFSIQIGEEGLRNFHRSDSYTGYVGEVPAAVMNAEDKKSAEKKLAAAVETELYYISDGKGAASLRYVPVGPYTVVKASTGEAVDMDALYASFGGSPTKNGGEEAAAGETAMQDSSASGLTAVELTSISNYKDALEQEVLDESLRAVSEIGLEEFELVRCSYRMNGEGKITAILRYTCDMTEDRLFGFEKSAYDEYMTWASNPIVYKFFEMDAKTGELLSIGTNYPLWAERQMAVESEAAVAESFLTACAAELFAESELCTLKGYGTDNATLTYVQVHDGYFYPENSLIVTVNPATGTVDNYRRTWEPVEFADSTKIVDEETAKKSYTDALDVTLGYVAWPEAIDYSDPVFQVWANWGYTWVESLCPAYYYTGTEKIAGVDALSGKAISETGDGSFVYEDISNLLEREQIETLGRLGIGFGGGKFLPEETLNMHDAAELLLRANGYDISDWDEETCLREAVSLGFVTASEWEPDSKMTRMEFIRMILSASSYGDAVLLENIWDTGFEDVSDSDSGYAAVARALGMVAGEKLEPDNECSRKEALMILYGFMTR